MSVCGKRSSLNANSSVLHPSPPLKNASESKIKKTLKKNINNIKRDIHSIMGSFLSLLKMRLEDDRQVVAEK